MKVLAPLLPAGSSPQLALAHRKGNRSEPPSEQQLGCSRQPLLPHSPSGMIELEEGGAGPRVPPAMVYVSSKQVKNRDQDISLYTDIRFERGKGISSRWLRRKRTQGEQQQLPAAFSSPSQSTLKWSIEVQPSGQGQGDAGR